MKNSIKSYFENEINSIKTPSFPKVKKTKNRPWDNIMLAACAMLTVVILYHPTSTNSVMRNIMVPDRVETIIKDEFTRGISSGMIYFREKESK